jgi:hypothetical protein
MWEGWKKISDSDESKSYELLLTTQVGSSKIVVLLLANLWKIEIEPFGWRVNILAFNPGAGEYLLYEDNFSNFHEGEMITWEKAREIESNYRLPKSLTTQF